MPFRPWPSVLAVVFALAVFPALATDGAVPIWEPTTITEPGRYVVTRNIVTEGFFCDFITIESNDVDLDLNGHVLEHSCSDPLGGGMISANNVSGITIRNGTLRPGFEQLGVWLWGITDFAVRGLVVYSADGGIHAHGSNGVIEDNTVEGVSTGIHVSGTAIQVRNNRVLDANMLIAGTSGGNLVEENILSGCFMEVSGNGHLLSNNVVTGDPWSDGMIVGGDFCHIEGNLLTGNAGCGLRYGSSGDNNIYRRNTAFNNGTDFCDEGTNNISHGDNYMPGQM